MKKYSLSKILCNNFDEITYMPKDAFHIVKPDDSHEDKYRVLNIGYSQSIRFIRIEI